MYVHVDIKASLRTHGSNKSPYVGRKPSKSGLTRWFQEKWKNQRGETGYKYKNDIYRPTRRITKETPTTIQELTQKEIEQARKEKYRKGRVKRFHGGRKNGIMQERILRIEKGKHPKKYTAFVQNLKTKKIRKLNFGDRRYEQYKDSTPLKAWAHKNHNSFLRRRNYFKRHSGVNTKKEALQKEKKKNSYLYTPKILSHTYLW